MKKLLLTLFCGMLSLSSFAQISVLKTGDTESKPKSVPYDSLQPRMLSYDLDKSYNYQRYVGQKLVFMPMSDKRRGEFKTDEFMVEKAQRVKGVSQKVNIYKPILLKSNDVSTDPTALENKSFLILNIWSESHTNVTSKTAIQDTISLYEVPIRSQLIFKLLDEENNILYWVVRRSSLHYENYMIQGYYDRLVQRYKDRDMVYASSEASESVDVNSGETVSIKPLSQWVCKGLSLAKGEPWYKLCYLLSSNEGKTISADIQCMFQLKADYEKDQEAERLRLEEEEKVRQKEAERQERMSKEYAENIVKMFGKTNGELILQKKVALGMTKDMCRVAWGTPQTIVQNENIESWVYNYTTFLYFMGDKLVQIINNNQQ